MKRLRLVGWLVLGILAALGVYALHFFWRMRGFWNG